jgi:tetratricopeptide (TPR) repeat protein
VERKEQNSNGLRPGNETLSDTKDLSKASELLAGSDAYDNFSDAENNTNYQKRPNSSWVAKFFAEPWVKELARIRRDIAKGSASKNQIFTAVNKLLNKGMKYDAIRLLYELNYFREAADILRAIGATSDAARLYVKAKNWEQAEHCYTILQDKLNAAKCAKASGKYLKAAPVFEELKDWQSAARCYRELGDWRRAAFLFGKAGKDTNTIKCLQEWVRTNAEALNERLAADEIKIVIDLLAVGKFEPVLFNFVESHDKVPHIIYALLKQNRMPMAVEIYGSRFQELSKNLCAIMRHNPDMVEVTISLCQQVGDIRGVAELYEITDRLKEATEHYEAIGDFNAAYLCALKCEWWEKINALKTGFIEKKALPVAIQSNDSSPSLMSAPKAIDLRSGVFSLNAEEAKADMQQIGHVEHGFGAIEPSLSGDMAPAFVESRFFRQLSSADRSQLWNIGSVVSFEAGSTIVDIGTTPASTYTLLSGVVEIYRQDGRVERLVDRIEPGQNFGESWLMVNLNSEVKIVASVDCHLHIIERHGFEQFMASETKNTTRIVSLLAQALCTHLLQRFGVNNKLPAGMKSA